MVNDPERSYVWGLDNLDAGHPRSEFAGGGNLMVFSSDGRQAMSCNWNGVVCLRDPASGKEIRSFSAGAKRITAFCYLPGNKLALIATMDRAVKVWDLETGTVQKEWPSLSYPAGVLSPSADGSQVLVGSDRLAICRTDTGEAVAFLGSSAANGDPCWAATWSADGHSVIAGYFSGRVVEYPLGSGQNSRVMLGHVGQVQTTVATQDGRLAISDSLDGTVRVWNRKSGQSVILLSELDANLKWLMYSDDGYWDGSESCGDLVAMSRGLQVWNIDQFALRTNRPDILAQRLDASADLVADFRGAWQQRLRKNGVTETGLGKGFDPPRATITAIQPLVPGDGGKTVRISLDFEAGASPLYRY